MTKDNPTRLLAFFSKKHYGAYAKMIVELRPWLVNSNDSYWQIERLEFCPDLPRGSRKLIYQSIARLLKPGNCVFARGFCKNDLFRWLSDPRHTNLGTSFQKIKAAVYQSIKDGI